jgi:hypothetical protein
MTTFLTADAAKDSSGTEAAELMGLTLTESAKPGIADNLLAD